MWEKGRLLVERDGATVALDACTWILRRPCGCLAATAAAGVDLVCIDHARHVFFAGLKHYGREVSTHERRGFAIELVNVFDASTPVYPRLEDCPHGNFRTTKPRTLAVGERFGRLTVTKQRNPGEKQVQCRCDCGADVAGSFALLSSGHTRSCGCYRSEVTTERSTRHGMCDTTEYWIWGQMVQRCTNPAHPRYEDYGGRGITLHEPWLDFANFHADMGARPEGRSLDRIDNDKGYSPENCRWASAIEQRQNRRKQRLKPGCKSGHPFTPDNTSYTKDGKRKCKTCVREWAKAGRERRKAAA